MNITELITSSFHSIKSNKLRSFLTMLGVIIGVFSVVTLISLGRGIQNYVTDEFEALGSNLLFVSPGKVGFGSDPAQSLTDNKLDEKHIDLIEKNVESVIAISPYIVLGKTAEYKTNNFYSELSGVNSDSFLILNYEVVHGRAFSDTEEQSNARVLVIGPEVKQNLFGDSDALGKSIKIENTAYEVVGVFAEKGDNYDDQILIPYTTVMKEFDIKNFASIVTKVSPETDINLAMKEIDLALLRDLKREDFTVLSQADLLSSIQQVLSVLTLGLGAIAAISLLVGGIGIMNIMLVSVTERTREIGLRKALGATPINIAVQFLAESIFISFVGGFIGLFFGYLASLIAQNFLRAEVPLYAVFLAFGFSVFVGMTFGTYPAIKASKKDPIEALRYE